jgi:2-polyprenyl-3-methyl-5-hydroxy-6-metoxy-1,4-benzoquinol methylase
MMPGLCREGRKILSTDRQKDPGRGSGQGGHGGGQRLHIDPHGKATLDVGCGGGLLAEEFARLGCQVTGVDPSEPSLETARAHAAASGLSIDYRAGAGEALPFPDGYPCWPICPESQCTLWH